MKVLFLLFVSFVLVGQKPSGQIGVRGELTKNEEILLLKKSETANNFVKRNTPCRFVQSIDIEVSKKFKIPMALVPAWRGETGKLNMPRLAIDKGVEPLAHELTHIHCPNSNRMLAEGFAVYIQEKFGHAVYPNFGKDISGLIRSQIHKVDIVKLDRVPTPIPLRVDGDGKLAYLAAGSFVHYLIETYGNNKFHELYSLTPMSEGKKVKQNSNRYRDIFGINLEVLESNWKKNAQG